MSGTQADVHLGHLKEKILGLFDSDEGGEVLIALDLLREFIDDICLETAFEAHRAAKTGRYCSSCQAGLAARNEGKDIFGYDLNKPMEDPRFLCPSCGRVVVASNYAPHLEKCMGLGRTSRASSRLATRRIRTTDTEDREDVVYFSWEDDSDNDDDTFEIH